MACVGLMHRRICLSKQPTIDVPLDSTRRMVSKTSNGPQGTESTESLTHVQGKTCSAKALFFRTPENALLCAGGRGIGLSRPAAPSQTVQSCLHSDNKTATSGLEATPLLHALFSVPEQSHEH